MLINKRITVTIVLLGAAALALFGGVIIPSFLSIRSLETSIADEQAKLEERYAGRLRARTSAAVLQKNREKFASISRAAIKEGEELAFVNALETAAPAGVEQDIALETANQKDLSEWEREIPIRIRMRGGFADIVRYMNAMERLPYAVIIESIRIAGPRSAGAVSLGNAVDADLAGIVYWQSKDAPLFLNIDVPRDEAKKP